MTARSSVAILVSGRGSNMQALIRAAATADHPARIVSVISDRPDAPALDIARREGIATTVVPSIGDPTDARPSPAKRAAFQAALGQAMHDSGADIFCLAGFMQILGAELVAAFERRILNIHPSLLPAFKGLDTHQRALDAGVCIHGATVHIVTPRLDEGPILAQAAVPVCPGDDAARLAERVLFVEHRLYPAALAHFIAEPAPVPPTREVPPLFNPPL